MNVAVIPPRRKRGATFEISGACVGQQRGIKARIEEKGPQPFRSPHGYREKRHYGIEADVEFASAWLCRSPSRTRSRIAPHWMQGRLARIPGDKPVLS